MSFVKNLFCCPSLSHRISRLSQRFLTSINTNHQKEKDWGLTNLTTRSVIRIHGKDSSAFLQGLITNDMQLLDEKSTIYSFMLNLQGRIMFDLFIHKDSDEYGGFLVDCDASMQEKLVKHLKMYKLRKDVAVEQISNHHVLALFPLAESPENQPGSLRDPRLATLGYRCLLQGEAGNIEKVKEKYNSPILSEMDYRRFRYASGVAEGSLELPPGECFPFESNGDYLNAVHFHKGCYLGQELTARTHHTGVVRKRIMPIVIKGLVDGETLERDLPIMAANNKSVGKLRAHLGKDGIALMRINEALAAESLTINHSGKMLNVIIRKPIWWPEHH